MSKTGIQLFHVQNIPKHTYPNFQKALIPCIIGLEIGMHVNMHLVPG